MCESDALGGAEAVILRLSIALRDRGHRVVGIGPDELTQPDRGTNGWLRQKFLDEGMPWRTYRKTRPVDPTLAGRLRATLSEVRAAAVHSHEFGMAVYGAAASRPLGVPHVISMHGNMNMTRKWTRRVALRWAFARSRATVAVSEETRQHLESTLGLPAGKISVIRNGVPERVGDRAAGRRSVGASSDEVLIIAVGSLVPRKGHQKLLEALDLLDAEGIARPWRLCIAGAGEERALLEAFASQSRIAGRVQLLGPRDDIPDLLAAADVFTMPSLWEGLPLAILEAMFASKAIVASNASGIPEAIAHDKEGLLVAPGDVPGLARALRRVIEDASTRSRLGTAAYARAQREFTLDAMADAYERLYGVRN